MKYKIMILLVLILIGTGFATMSADEINRARQLIDSNKSCDKLTGDELESIGDYYMEQMHPGTAHDAMERMLGGEGSANLRQTHIQMAQVIYCGETNTTLTYGGMMGIMPMVGRFGNYGFGGDMIGYSGMMNYGNMMGYGDWWSVGFGLLFWGLIFAALVLVIIWLYRNLNSSNRSGSALDVLKQRYAKGEISKKQYEEIRQDLE